MVRSWIHLLEGLQICVLSLQQRFVNIEKGNEEIKLTSDVHNRPPYYLINRVVGCVHPDMFAYLTL